MVNPQSRPTTDDNVLVSDISGGLNKTSSALNQPLGDSPFMRNVRVNEAGNVVTRHGTQYVEELTSSSTVGFAAVSYKTKAGRNLVFIKNTVHIDVYEFIATKTDQVDSFTKLMTKTDVWPAIASGIRFDHVVTNETNSRIILTTGIATPVQIQLFETSQTITSGSTINNFTVDSPLTEHASTSNIVVWVNGTRTDISSVSFASDTLTVTFTDALAAGTYFVDFMFITWQWWAEAALFEGRSLYQPQTRNDSDVLDLSVAIPTDLIRTFNAVKPGAFNVLAYETTVYSDEYVYNVSRQPLTYSQFAFSQGVTYDPADNNDLVPGISHVTFGQLSGTNTISEVHFVKAENLRFNGGAKIAGQDLLVLVDDEAATQNVSTGAASGTSFGDSYYLRNTPAGAVSQFYNTSGVVTSASTPAEYISFDATPFVGLAFNSLVKIINKNDNSFAGTAATNTYTASNNYKDGNLVPAYGLYEWADYAAGSFPRTCELYQGRLVFGGFPNKPLQVVFSNTFDSAEPDVFFNDFSVATQDLESTDAVAVFVSSVENDAAITAIKSFAGSLFVFTANKTIRLFGGDSGITPVSINSSVVASIGALNAQCVELVDNSVIYLSSNGLYQLTPALQVGDFTVRPASANITSLLKNINNANVAWITYNSNDNEMFVAVTDNDSSLVANRLYHLSLFREAWTEYALFYGRFNTSYGLTVSANQAFTLMTVPRSIDSVDTEFDIIAYPYFYPIDIAKTETGSLGVIDFDIINVGSATYESNLELLPIDYLLSPITKLQDIRVVVEGNNLTFNKDFFKRAENPNQQFINISKLLQVGDSVIHYPINDDGQYPVAIFMDNIEQTDYTLAVSTSQVRATINFTNAVGTVKRYGYTFPKLYITPLLVRQTITRPKSLKHLYVLLENTEFLGVYTKEDLNTGQNQPLQDLLGVWKRRVGVRIGLRLDRASSTFKTNQLSEDLLYDVGRYDIDASATQSVAIAKVAFSLNGLANHIQLVFYSLGLTVWELTAYELETRYAQRSSKNSFD